MTGLLVRRFRLRLQSSFQTVHLEMVHVLNVSWLFTDLLLESLESIESPPEDLDLEYFLGALSPLILFGHERS